MTGTSSTNKRTYAAYGLTFESMLPLPELSPGERRSNASITFGIVDRYPTELCETSCFCYFSSECEAYFYWNDVGNFLVRNGNEIILAPESDVDECALRLFVLGPGLAALLHQRGFFVLHASAVARNREAVLFLGASGAGKSTVAAAMHDRGYEIVADDVVPVDVSSPTGLTICPGFPQVKLWPDSASFLGKDLSIMPRLRPEAEKRGWGWGDRYSDSMLNLRHVYVLTGGRDANLAIERLGKQETFIEVIRNSHGVQFLKCRDSSQHVFQCAQFSRTILANRVTRAKSLDRLPDLVDMLIEDIEDHKTADLNDLWDEIG